MLTSFVGVSPPLIGRLPARPSRRRLPLPPYPSPPPPPAVSHEVRTPLNAVLGAAALLSETPLSEEQRELVGMLEAGANNVVVVIDDILQIKSLGNADFRARLGRTRAPHHPTPRTAGKNSSARHVHCT